MTSSNDSGIDDVPVDDNRNLLLSLRRSRKVKSSLERRLFCGRLFLVGIFALGVFIFQISKLHLSMWTVVQQQHQLPSDELELGFDQAQSSDNVGTTSDKLDREGVDRVISSQDLKEPADESNNLRPHDQSITSTNHGDTQANLNATKVSKLVEGHGHKKSTKTRVEDTSNDLSKRTESDTDRLAVRSKSKSTKRDRRRPSKEKPSSLSSLPSSSHLPAIHPVVIQHDEVFLWNGAQRRLCDHIKKEVSTLDDDNTRIGLFLKIPCLKVHQRSQHGNVLVGYYGMRIAAMAFNASFTFQCVEDDATLQKQSYFGWLQSNESSSTTTNGSNHTLSLYHPMHQPTKKEACTGMGKVALQYSSEYARRDLRRIADDLSAQLAPTLDEVAIHWRCGDVLSGKIPKKDQNYGLLKFQAYARRIPDNVRSIGIVTAPFNSRHNRKEDRDYGSDCEYIAGNLVSYLQRHYPDATIAIRNDVSETIPQVMSRLILAKYTFCARSTFCLFPAVASYGQSFVQQGGVAYFFNSIAEQTYYDNIHMMDEPVLLSYEVVERGINQTVEWLLSD